MSKAEAIKTCRTLSAQGVEVELVLQTRNRAHVAEVVQQLSAAGFEAQTA